MPVSMTATLTPRAELRHQGLGLAEVDGVPQREVVAEGGGGGRRAGGPGAVAGGPGAVPGRPRAIAGGPDAHTLLADLELLAVGLGRGIVVSALDRGVVGDDGAAQGRLVRDDVAAVAALQAGLRHAGGDGQEVQVLVVLRQVRGAGGRGRGAGPALGAEARRSRCRLRDRPAGAEQTGGHQEEGGEGRAGLVHWCLLVLDLGASTNVVSPDPETS